MAVVDDHKTVEFSTLSLSISMSAVVILVYDHLLTLDREIAYIWIPLRRKRRSAAWFLFTRYFPLLSTIAMCLTNFGDYTIEKCKHYKLLHGVLTLAQEFIVGCHLILRVYAMYDLNKTILSILLATAAATVAIGAWSIVPTGTPLSDTIITLPGCQTPVSHAQSMRIAGAWEAELACDALIVGLIVFRAFQLRRGQPVSIKPGSPFKIMVRDGVMYFLVIFLANLGNILMLSLGSNNTSGSLSWFTASISVVMITRLMLNLHAAADVSDLSSSLMLGTLHGVDEDDTGTVQFS
ncbi:hypothetical protein FB45DRAFT_1059993 [Roridomyces roridus]|uniref:DUF6533 domain-containing protein n=1 Tax=Roridomyces roridus TaxID=1738132 RepID=A0AAD7FJ58_9AGAR|nr:hypothetical protein FB45DRAFT_1059993 [Roridomyces roridus]